MGGKHRSSYDKGWYGSSELCLLNNSLSVSLSFSSKQNESSMQRPLLGLYMAYSSDDGEKKPVMVSSDGKLL